MTVLLCFTTAPDGDTARSLADALVGDGLAACVNILPGVRSIYRWQGRVEHGEEHLLLVKTTAETLPALQARLLALHPYELPELVAVEAAAGLPAYLDWVATATIPR